MGRFVAGLVCGAVGALLGLVVVETVALGRDCCDGGHP